MNTFQIGETVICYCEVKRGGVLYDPSSVSIAITTENGTAVVSSNADKEAVGKYSYTFSSTGKTAGKYRARFTATDAGKTSKKDTVFRLES